MDILNSGSFVPLDNREKIEQLKFTAKELANESVKTAGFQNNGPTNQQIAVEMWKGAEYVCRGHEEATIRNIFLSSFLEKLRDLARVTGVQPQSHPVQAPKATLQQNAPPVIMSPPQPAVPTVEQAPSADTTDEYLGVVPSIEELDRELRPSYADECIPEYDADMEALVDRLEDEESNSEAGGSSAPIKADSEQTAIVDTADESSGEVDSTTIEGNVHSETVENEIHIQAGESTESDPIKSIVVAEKEPYNFDGCTVTAVVQLLPEIEGVRKCVVSVRTHDFSPRVVVADVEMADPVSQIAAAMKPMFEQYRNELPVMAAEKLKKEKPVSKKTSKTGAKASKTGPSAAKLNSAEPQSTGTPTAAQNQGGLFAT